MLQLCKLQLCKLQSCKLQLCYFYKILSLPGLKILKTTILRFGVLSLHRSSKNQCNFRWSFFGCLMKISVVFEGRLNALDFESDTVAKAGMCDGAACIAWMSQTVENRKFS